MLFTAVTNWTVLAGIIAVTLTPALFIARLTAGSISGWYSSLRKPSWNPPNWLFGPVWTVLYLAMSVALWLVWQAQPCSHLAIGLYAGQLVLNHAWSPLFFLLRKPGLAFLDISALVLTATATAIHFYSVVPLAGQLMLPYLAWLLFAAALNYRIWQDNRSPSL